jgi:hypothetical protein
MFYATSSKHLFLPFAIGLDDAHLQPDFAEACKQASTVEGVPVVLEVEDNAIVNVWAKDDEWFQIDPAEIAALVESATAPKRLVVAVNHRGQMHSWAWRCDDMDGLMELQSAVSSVLRQNDFKSLPAPLNYHFALAEVKPELRVDGRTSPVDPKPLLRLDGTWKWQKKAAIDERVAKGEGAMDVYFALQDLDRFATDRFGCYVSFGKTITGYDLSFQINAAQLGIASSIYYWHYKDSEEKQARKTASEIRKLVKQFVDQQQDDKAPFANIGPNVRAMLQDVDPQHREGTGVFLVQESFRLPFEKDWRETLYGNRYPGHVTSNVGDGEFAVTQTRYQEEQKSQTFEVRGRDSRQQQYHAKYASHQTPVSHPVLVKTALYNMVKWIQETVSVPRVPSHVAVKVLSNLEEEALEKLLMSPVDTLLELLQ